MFEKKNLYLYTFVSVLLMGLFVLYYLSTWAPCVMNPSNCEGMLAVQFLELPIYYLLYFISNIFNFSLDNLSESFYFVLGVIQFGFIGFFLPMILINIKKLFKK
ncbi:MAG: hypothetical protein PHQ18_04310 [Patescibacteria group bacterium]|nr:hypothetical protein [Patescibacteria group bacterium]